MQHVQKIYADYKEQTLKDYKTFLRFESVSTDPAYKPQMTACVNWLTKYIRAMGFEVTQWPTSSHPVLFAHDLRAGPEKPTLLIYNHYDVQPVDPINEWTSPPFEPTERNGEIYARGAQDNKGQCIYVLQALNALRKKYDPLPVNIKLCIEGDEECGSTGLTEILQDESIQRELKADYLAVVDLGLHSIDAPSITLGTRGLVALEVQVKGSFFDLHSGSHGGIAYNPLHALVEMLAALRDATGKIAVPGFYDDVAELSNEERNTLSLAFDAGKYEAMFGAKPLGGESHYTPSERLWYRPTIEINGISGGYSGAGTKTVIPAKASAKLSCRLVPDQHPHKIGELVARFLRQQAPKGVDVEIEVVSGGGKAIRADHKSLVVIAFKQAYEELFNKPCEYILCGASIPVAPLLVEASESEIVFLGLGLPDDQIHAPNEHFGIDRLEKGFCVLYRAIELLGEPSKYSKALF